MLISEVGPVQFDIWSYKIVNRFWGKIKILTNPYEKTTNSRLSFYVFRPLYLKKTVKINLSMQSQSVAYTGNHFENEVCAPIMHGTQKSTFLEQKNLQDQKPN